MPQLHFFACVLLLILTVSAQTSFMYNLLGTTSHMWLAITVYIAMYRGLTFCITWAYVSTILLLLFSYSQISYLLLGQIVLIFVVRLIVKNVFYDTLSYFIRVYLFSIVLFYITTILIDYVIHGLPFHVGSNLIIQTIQSIFVGTVIFYAMKILDTIRTRVSEKV